MRVFRSSWIVLGIALAACSTPPGSPSATSVPTTYPTTTGTPTPSTTPTQTATNTLTPTSTPTPTLHPTLTPTATPEGFYFHSDAGFGLVPSDEWEFLEEGFEALVLRNEQRNLILIAGSEIRDPNTRPEDKMEELIFNIEGTDRLEIEERDQIALAGGVTAQRTVASLINQSGVAVTYHLVVAGHGSRIYTFVLFGPTPNVFGSKRILDNLYASIELRGNEFQGIPADRAIVMLGFPPDRADLDPALTTRGAAGYAGHLFSGLVRLTRDLRIEPDLAENWDVSPDGMIYTFVLRKGITFLSGDPITAHDFQFSWERAADPDLDSPTAATYLGDIAGFLAVQAGEADEISGVRVLDDRSLEITLDAPKPYFLAKLTYPTSFVVHESDIEHDPEDWMFEPNASGPFFLEERQVGEALVFQRNTSYHTPVRVDAIVYLLSRFGPQTSFFEAGEIDIAYPQTAEISRVLDPDDPLNARLRTSTSMCTSYLAMNNRLPPLDDPAVRKALALAIDRDELHALLHERRHLTANSILPPAMPGFSSVHSAARFDPESARDALVESSYGAALPEIILTASGFGDTTNPFVDAVISMWKEHLGVAVDVRFLIPESFLKDVRLEHGHVVVHGWCADYPDPQNFLDILFFSGGAFNYAAYTNPDIDHMLEAARVEPDVAARLTLYHKIEAALLADYAAIPLFHWINYTLVSEKVGGFAPNPIHAPFFHLLWIAE